MIYDLRATSSDLLYPVHTFPGDEQISAEQYRQTIFSGYLSSVTTLYGVARGYGLQIDSETFERWKRIGAAAGLIDDFLDESADLYQASNSYDDGLVMALEKPGEAKPPEKADPRLGTVIALLQNSIQPVPTFRKESLTSAARNIGRVSVIKAECDDVSEYIQILRREAEDSSVLIKDSASYNVRAQPGFGAFAVWCSNALEFGTLADHARDLWADYRAGRTKVSPTVLQSIRIAMETRDPARNMMKSPEDRRATVAGWQARARFSLLPTNIAMKRAARRLRL